MDGAGTVKQMQDAGFSSNEIGDWQAQQSKSMQEAGFGQDEIQNYWGQKPFNPAPMAAEIKSNLDATAKPGADGAQPKPVTNFLDAIDAGWKISVSGLMLNKKAPDTQLAADAPMASRIASNVTTLAGDFPFMVAGAAVGTVGGAETGPGAAVTGMAGAFALPAGLRSTLMDSYKKGNFTNFQDFWARASGIMIDTAKGWLTGAATGAAGKAAEAVIGPGGVAAIASPTARAVTQTSAEIATMTTVGKALEGQVPNLQDFTDAAIMVGGLKGAHILSGKMQDSYAKWAVKPEDVVADARKDPTIAQDLLSTNRQTPTAYGPNEPEVPPATETPAGEPPAAGTPEEAQAKILSKISVGGKEDSKPPLTFDKVYQNMVDDLYPLKQAVDAAGGKENIPVAENPYALARLTRGDSGRADHMLNYGTYDFKTYENNGPGLKQVLEPVRDDLNGFRAFAVASRAVELDGRGIKTGVDIEAAKKVISDGGKYSKPFQEFVDYQNRVARWGKDSGILSEESFNAMKDANKNFVPYYRVMGNGKGGGPEMGGRTLQARNVFQRIKGSERDIIDPVESAIKNTYAITAMAAKNEVGRAFIDMADKTEAPEAFYAKVKTPMKPTTVSEPEMTKFLQAHGIDEIPEDLLTVFRASSRPLGDDEIRVFNEGKAEVYKVDPDMAIAFKGMDKQGISLFTKIMAVPAQLLKAGATLLPEFALKHAFRDYLYAGVTSEKPFTPVDMAKGMWGLLTKDKDYQNWLKSGGSNNSTVSLDRRYLQENLRKLTEETGLMTRSWNVISHPLDGLRALTELSENISHLGAFKKSIADKENPDKADLQKAGFASRETAVDVARIGANMRAYNMITAFANVTIQDTDRVVRAVKDNPLGASAKIVAGIVLPSALLWWANHDDPRYKEIPQWEKDLFWIVMTKDHIFRVTKPFGMGALFGSGTERVLDAVAGDKPNALKDFDQTIKDVMVPGIMPTMIPPMIDQFANRSTFTNAPLIPDRLEKLLPEYQYNPYTLETTKALGSLIGSFPGMTEAAINKDPSPFGGIAQALTTPVLMENYLRAWTGGLGMYTLQLADLALRKAGVVPDPVLPAGTLSDIPVIRAFTVRYPTASAQSIQDFYSAYETNKVYLDTINAKAKEGDIAAVQKTQRLNPAAMVQLDGIKQALGMHSQLVRNIWSNPQIPADEKRQLIDTTYYRMIEMAHAGNEAMENLRKAIKP